VPYSVIAVGTAVASRPPHRSVRDGLRHTAPPSGRTIAENSVTSRDCRATPIDARSGSVSGASVTVQQNFPSVTSFPRQIPLRRLPLCSPVSIVLRSHLTSQKRSCQHCPRKGSLAAQGVIRHAALHLRLMGSPGSRVWNVHACPGSQTPPCSSMPCHKRQRRCGLLPVRTGSAHESGDVGAQWLACVTLRTDAQDNPVTRSAPPLKAEAVG